MKEKKSLLIILTVLLILTSALFFGSGCKTSALIRIVVDGEYYKTIPADNFSSLKDPKKKNGYFDGWFLDEGTWQQPFSEALIKDLSQNEKITIYAKWHDHLYSSEWTGDDTHHWLPSTCGHEHMLANYEPHFFTEWQKTISPTCLSEGEEKRSCSVCGYTQSQIIKAGGHDYVDKVCSVCRQNQPSDGLHFTLSSDKTYYVLDGIGECEDTQIGIPSSFDGLPVGEISNGAFSGQTQITSVTLPNEVTKIGEKAFFGCTALETVVLSENIKFIGENAFANCDNLKLNEYQNGLYLGNNGNNYLIFIKPTNLSLTNLQIHSNAKLIYHNALQGANGLQSLSLPFVGDGCENSHFGIIFGAESHENQEEFIPTTLFEVEITAKCEIYANAFYNCSNITDLKISDGVTYIGESAFANCDNLNFNEYQNGLYLGNDENPCLALICAVDQNATEFEINENAKIIYCNALANMENLTSLTIPKSVVHIGANALFGLKKLQNLSIPFVGDGHDNTHLGYIFGASEYFENPDFIPSALKRVEITNAEVIGANAFYNCLHLTEIIIPNTVTEIAKASFFGTSSLQKLTLPFAGGFKEAHEETESILFGYIFGESQFENSTQIYQYFYSDFAYRNYYIPTSLKTLILTGEKIHKNAFSFCKTLTEIILTDNVKEIEQEAFKDCTSLANLIIPDSVTKIGNAAFMNCIAIETLTIGKNVTEIGSSAFYNCTNLTTLNYNATAVKDINQPITSASATFSYSEGYEAKELTTYIASNVTRIPAYLFFAPSSSSSSLVKIIFAENSLCKSIGKNAFSSCNLLTEIEIPNTVTEIGDSAFAYCEHLKTVKLPSNLSSISEDLFWQCYELQNVTLPESVIQIGEFAFANTKITSITIPKNVTKIGEFAFSKCDSLKKIVFEDSSNWYRTENDDFTGGKKISLWNSSQNVDLLSEKYADYNLYKK